MKPNLLIAMMKGREVMTVKTPLLQGGLVSSDSVVHSTLFSTAHSGTDVTGLEYAYLMAPIPAVSRYFPGNYVIELFCFRTFHLSWFLFTKLKIFDIVWKLKKKYRYALK